MSGDELFTAEQTRAMTRAAVRFSHDLLRRELGKRIKLLKDEYEAYDDQGYTDLDYVEGQIDGLEAAYNLIWANTPP